MMYRKGFLTAVVALSLVLPVSAQANSCIVEYERGAHDYWLIVSDILRFKTMFDNYDRLCAQHYPDEMAALQESADLLRKQVSRDIADAEKVIRIVFDDYLAQDVTQDCRDNKTARDKVRRNFLSAMKTQTKTISARLEKSALSIGNPEQNLKICRDLKKLEPVVIKKLGAGMEHPLFEMSFANSKFMTKDAGKRKAAFTLYRDILSSLKD